MITLRPNESKRDYIARAQTDEGLCGLFDTSAKREYFAGAVWERDHRKKPRDKPWYRITNATDSHVEILIYEEIGGNFFGGGVEAKSFVEDLREMRGVTDINIRINSPGGNVFEGFAIYNALTRHPAHITVDIDGLAASIASVIALAGDTVHMAQNALFMMHNPSGFAVGTAADMRLMAEALDKIQSNLVDIYISHSTLSASRVQELMDHETWLTASEALSHHLINEVTEGQQLAAHFDLSRFQHVPEQAQALAAGRPRSVVAPREMFQHMQQARAAL